ncbi:hypothetical protein BJ508DRAFT_411271 [Ascobolus immersus RN42]|uniref:Uncharacterized protein n=1 Tax=Ascobolus immersus RN42 TaxID=1160509 RepID=A0A3N4IKE7_ASCIM|nr:hypothetical protein BJ508DRAFT_411271 [Ascobolus immersus RN42]
MDSFKEKITSRIPDRSSIPSPGDKLKSLVGRGGGSGSSSPVSARPISALGDPNRFGPPPKRTVPADTATLAQTPTGGSSNSSAGVSRPLSTASPKPSLPPRLPPRTGSISSLNSPTTEDAHQPPPPPAGRRPILSTPSDYAPAAPRALPSSIQSQVGPARLPALSTDIDDLLKDTKKRSTFASTFGNKKPQTVVVKSDTGRELTFDSYADDAQMKRLAEQGIGASGLGIQKDAPDQSGWGSGKDFKRLVQGESTLGGKNPAPPLPSKTQSKPLSYEEAKAQVLAPLRKSDGEKSSGFSWKEAKESAATAKKNYETAKTFEAQHGDQLRSGLASANRLQERHGDKITKALGEEQAGQMRMGLAGATKSADISKAVVGKKKPPPPPPKKKDLVVGSGPGTGAGGPPPVNFSSRPGM